MLIPDGRGPWELTPKRDFKKNHQKIYKFTITIIEELFI